jgi:hypothetical protein
MNENDEINITLTLDECARLTACVSAMLTMAKAGAKSGVPSALALVTSVSTLDVALEKLAAQLPEDLQRSVAKTKDFATIEEAREAFAPAPEASDPTDPLLRDMEDLSPDVAAAMFGTKYDVLIQTLRNGLLEHTNFTDDDFKQLLEDINKRLAVVAPMPKKLKVSESMPYVELSDMAVTAELLSELFERSDELEGFFGGPF